MVKNLEYMSCLFVSTEYTNVTDSQTDRQTDGQISHDSIIAAFMQSIAR